jgi:hypothetical protein
MGNLEGEIKALERMLYLCETSIPGVQKEHLKMNITLPSKLTTE